MKWFMWKRVSVFVLPLLLAACFNNNDDKGSSGSNAKDNLKGFASADMMTAEPSIVTNVESLEKDMSSVFGENDSEPVAVKAEDTALSVINRLSAK